MIYANPAITATPIAPYGMERIAQSFQLAGCDVTQIAPYIEANPLEHVQETLQSNWDLVGISIRNVDDALVVRSPNGIEDIDLNYYIDDIKPIVQAVLNSVGVEAVVLGGPGFSTAPRPLLDELGAKWGIAGPADDLCWLAGRDLAQHGIIKWPADPRVICATDPEVFPHQSPNRPRDLATTHAITSTCCRMGPYLGLTIARGGAQQSHSMQVVIVDAIFLR